MISSANLPITTSYIIKLFRAANLYEKRLRRKKEAKKTRRLQRAKGARK